MTLDERIVVSAYTGVLMCEFKDLFKYIEKILMSYRLPRNFAKSCARVVISKNQYDARHRDFSNFSYAKVLLDVQSGTCVTMVALDIKRKMRIL